MSPFPPGAIERQREHGRSQRQAALDFVSDYIAREGWSPTVREVAEALNVNVSTAHEHLRILAIEGRIVRGPGPRMIRVTAGGSITLR